MNKIFSQKLPVSSDKIVACVDDFSKAGKIFVKGDRNTIKTFVIDGITINIKSFKIPNIINKVAYKFFRKSKARRSFEHASFLLKNGIDTPEPLAYFENFFAIGLQDSYYVCKHLDYDFTFRELIRDEHFPEREKIIRLFAQFTYKIHQAGIEFKDHSPGNTLIKKELNGKYHFYLIDLNRMNFYPSLSFEKRMKNLSKITSKEEMVKIMSDEYAKLYGRTYNEVFSVLWKYTQQFQEKFYKKKALKKKFKNLVSSSS